MNELRVHNLRCSRGNRILLNKINFLLQSGQKLTFIGKNGSGKSTLLRTLAGLREPLYGYILRPSRCILIDHRNTLKTTLTVFENLRFWSLIYRTSPTLIKQALKFFSLYPLKDLSVKTLSLGQQQRLNLCRLILAPSTLLWLLDEPELSLDQEGRKKLELLLQTHRTNGGMVIIINHTNFLQDSGYILNLDRYKINKEETI